MFQDTPGFQGIRTLTGGEEVLLIPHPNPNLKPLVSAFHVLIVFKKAGIHCKKVKLGDC